jgi:hypothetical protein
LAQKFGEVFRNSISQLKCDCEFACPNCIYTYEFETDEKNYNRRYVYNYFAGDDDNAKKRMQIIDGSLEFFKTEYNAINTPTYIIDINDVFEAIEKESVGELFWFLSKTEYVKRVVAFLNLCCCRELVPI